MFFAMDVKDTMEVKEVKKVKKVKEVYIVFGDGHYVVDGVFSSFKKVKKFIKWDDPRLYRGAKKLSEVEFIMYVCSEI